MTFSTDGHLIASSGAGGKIQVWSTVDVDEARTLTGHDDSVLCARFSADGRRIISGSTDKTIKIWEAANGRESRTLPGFKSGIAASVSAPTTDGLPLVMGRQSPFLIRPTGIQGEIAERAQKLNRQRELQSRRPMDRQRGFRWHHNTLGCRNANKNLCKEGTHRPGPQCDFQPR